MALDRQRILSELGSVMNQLKSTDCGCMGKLFRDPGQNAVPTGGFTNCNAYKHGCCHSQGFNRSCGDAYANNTNHFHGSCLGRCNPPKLYADTYNYLNENLMQPKINEVYNDLRSITPANTVMNSPVAKQMGFPTENYLAQGANMPNGQIESQSNIGNYYSDPSKLARPLLTTPTNNPNMNNMGQIGGVGPQIMNMLGEDQSAKPSPMATNKQYNQNETVSFNGYPQNAIQPMNQPNMKPTENLQQIRNMNSIGGLPHQMGGNNNQLQGQHSPGVAKFNEMFPGLMKNGDLGFDPMAIAIQMNPANQKQTTMNAIHKLMTNNSGNKTLNTSDNNVANPGYHLPTNNQLNTPQNQIPNSIAPNATYQYNTTYQPNNPQMLPQQPNTVDTTQFQQVPQPLTYPYGGIPEQTNQNAYANVPSNSHQLQQPINYQQQQQPINYQQQQQPINYQQQQQPINYQQQQQPINYQQQQQQQISNPIKGNTQPNLPTVYEGTTYPNMQLQSQANQNTNITNARRVIKDPILPVDTSKFVMPKQKYYNYNTLGQPVEMLPGKMYHSPEPPLPQTLSPQSTKKSENNTAKYSNVKYTVSKTSLMGDKPVGKCPSRTQLQQIYNQYKGSQSFTQQNIKNQKSKNVSHSEGRLNLLHNTQNDITEQQMPIENVGGDTAANNQLNERSYRKEHVQEQIGDAPVTKPQPQDYNKPEKLSPVANRKYRNGLQDMVYTSYPSSAAWSFHGHCRASYHPPGFRRRR